MASRIMHYLIAELIIRQTEIENRNRFIFGALAPDMSSHKDGSYSAAHFGSTAEAKVLEGTDWLKGIDWLKFCEKYSDRILSDDLVLGYLVHLISDACWMKLIRDKYIRWAPDKKERQRMHYEDLWLYNGVLINEFHLQNDIVPEKGIAIGEIVESEIEPFFTALAVDFTCPYKDAAAYRLYPHEEILRFISSAVDLSVVEIHALRNGLPMNDPKAYYVGLQDGQ